jgi:hypothetical protein
MPKKPARMMGRTRLVLVAAGKSTGDMLPVAGGMDCGSVPAMTAWGATQMHSSRAWYLRREGATPTNSGHFCRSGTLAANGFDGQTLYPVGQDAGAVWCAVAAEFYV